MPFGDRTGPMGNGPMTGRAVGYCAGYTTPGNMNPGFGRGFARGMGRGRGFGRGYWRFGFQTAAPVRTVPVTQAPAQQYQPYAQEYTKEDEIADLKAEKEMIERELKAIDERISRLEKK